MRKLGDVDAEGAFFYRIIFGTASSFDMTQMNNLLNDPTEDTEILHFDRDYVEVIVYPGLPIPSQ